MTEIRIVTTESSTASPTRSDLFEVRLDQQIPDIPDRSRPDIVIIDDNQVSIIDVTCPFENDSDGHRTAEQENIAKYDHLKDHYIAQGKNFSVFGL